MFTWALTVVLIGAPLSRPDTSSGAEREVRLCAASIEAAGTDTVTKPLAVCLSVALGFHGAAG